MISDDILLKQGGVLHIRFDDKFLLNTVISSRLAQFNKIVGKKRKDIPKGDILYYVILGLAEERLFEIICDK